MQKFIFSFIISSFFLFLNSCSAGKENAEIYLTNTEKFERTDEFISIDLDKIFTSNPDEFSFSLLDGEKEIPYQIENTGGKKYLSFVLSFLPEEKKTLILATKEKNSGNQFKSRVYAEVAMKVDYNLIDGKYTGGRFQNFDSLKVPSSHTDHNALFKYEGPGWESDKIGYRFYIDWRNRIDIFGKKTNELVLKNVGINDIYAKDDSYHNMQEWGMDIFKVGNSLGIGSYGMMISDSIYTVSRRDSVLCRITENGPVKAGITTFFYGWQAGDKKYSLRSDLSITAGSRLTKSELTISGEPENLATGLAKDPNAELIEKKGEKKWSYFAVFGNHSLAGDKLGVAVFYLNENRIDFKETNDSYAVLLKPFAGKIFYYFCAAWEQELRGIKTKKEFISYLNKTLNSLDNPIAVEYKIRD